MYSRILVPLDGSELAEKVLPHVEILAEKFDATIFLIRTTLSEALLSSPAMAAMPITGVLPVEGEMAAPEEVLDAQRSEAHEYLDSVVARLQEKGIKVVCEQREGRPAEAIVAAAGANNADLIAMTTHGRGGLSRLFLGSVTDEVLRTASCPLLIVRSNEPHTRRH